LFTRQSKCSFYKFKIKYLWHILSAKGVAIDPRKIESIRNWPTPKTVLKLEGFIGLIGYYRKFIRGFWIRSRSLIELLQKNNLKWDNIHKKLLMSLKQPCVKLQYFALANSRKIFILETYVCATGLKAVLNKKKKEDHWHS